MTNEKRWPKLPEIRDGAPIARNAAGLLFNVGNPMSDATPEKLAETEATGPEENGLSAQEISAEEQARRRAAIDAILALRDSGSIKPVTLEEILAWRHEGHRY